MPDSTEETQEHIRAVQARLQEMISALTVRAAYHDRSKLYEPEKAILDAKAGALAELRYGTPEYAAAMAAVDMQPFLEHHYAHNDHHPQHWTWPIPDSPEAEEIAVLRHDIEVLEALEPQTEGGLESRILARLKRDLAVLESPVNAMSLLSASEMLADHKAASERTKEGSIEGSVDTNRDRFGYSDQLYNIFRNTVRELRW